MSSISLKDLFEGIGVQQSDLRRVTGLSRSTVNRLVAQSQWPARGAREVRLQIDAYLQTLGLPEKQLKTVQAVLVASSTKKLAPVCCEHTEAVPEVTETVTPEEESMLLQNEALSPEARKHFGLPRNPFQDDVQTPDDVFQSPSVRYVRAALNDCANNHGFMAVVGESGAGKSTLAEDLEERLRSDKRDVVIIRPYVLAMEANDQKGKTLKSSHIAEAIAAALDPQLKVKSSPEARFAQVHALLNASA